MANLALIPTDLVRECWPALKPFIEKAISRLPGRLSADEYLVRCSDGQMQAWTAVEDGSVIAVMISEVHQFKTQKILRLIICVGGGLKKWLGFLPEVERWAHSNGCSGIEPIARKGWERVLRRHGYRLTHVMLYKEI